MIASPGTRIRIDVDARHAAIVRCQLLCQLAPDSSPTEPWGSGRFSIQGLEKVFGAAEVCAAVVVGPELRYAYVNQSYRRIRAEVAMVGRTYAEVFPEAAAGGAQARLQQVMETETSWVVDDYPTPLPHRDVPAWWQGECVPINLGGSTADAVLILIWDVSHRHLREAKPVMFSKSKSRIERARQALAEQMAELGLTAGEGWTICEEVRETAAGTSWILRPLHLRHTSPPIEVTVLFESADEEAS